MAFQSCAPATKSCCREASTILKLEKFGKLFDTLLLTMLLSQTGRHLKRERTSLARNNKERKGMHDPAAAAMQIKG